MSILDGKIMKENDLTPFGKAAILLVVLLSFASAGTNIVQGHVSIPQHSGSQSVGSFFS